MSATVTDVIVARSRSDDDLTRMVWWSVAGHALVLTMLVFWSGPFRQVPRENVMTISLGGVPGPKTGGLTEIGARAVQAPRPPTETRKAVTPPAPVPPKMSLPDPKSKPRTTARPEQAPPKSSARTASTGEEPADGNARAETSARRGQGFGLSSSGGAGGPVQVDDPNFCCPDYLAELVPLLQRSWDQNQGVAGSTGIKFTVLRDGTIQAPQVETPSGFIALDASALRAVQLARLPPLPAAYQNPSLTIHVRFDYQR